MYATAKEYLGIYKQHETTLVENPPVSDKKEVDVNLQWNVDHIHNTADPRIWGPAFWFSLHSSAAHYPYNASPIVKERMKGRILAIPYEIPCAGCRPHASAFVEANRDKLDQIVSGRHELGKFYVEFHNKVNERYGKPLWKYEDAYKFYSGNARVKHLKYN